MKQGSVILITVFLFLLPEINSGVAGQIKTDSSLISRVSVLSIHVRDTLVHDSVYHFLNEKLGLSVEYYPVKWSDRKYAGLYAGNMFLEPCGPYTNFRYASDNFRAIFFGLNCESGRSLRSLAKDLTQRHIDLSQDGTIQVSDTSFINQNIYLSIASGKGPDKVKEDSLRSIMTDNNKNALGIERIKEIRICYTDEKCLDKWKKVALPSVISDAGLWKVNEDQSVRFVKGNIKEVNAIVFKVRSLDKARNWLSANNLLGNVSSDEIALDKSKSFGLLIILREAE